MVQAHDHHHHFLLFAAAARATALARYNYHDKAAAAAESYFLWREMKELDSFTQLRRASFASISRILRENPRITSLRLSLHEEQQLNETSVDTFIDALRMHPRITKLQVSTTAGMQMEQLAVALAKHVGDKTCSLEDLEICASTAGCRGWVFLQTLVPALQEALPYATRLKRLALKEIIPTGSVPLIQSLCRVFEQNTSLTKIEIQFRSSHVDPLLEEVVAWIVSAIPPRNRRLQFLDDWNQPMVLWPWVLESLLSSSSSSCRHCRPVLPTINKKDQEEEVTTATTTDTHFDSVTRTAVYSALRNRWVARYG